MSDPVSNSEIEDVLASIRRLVSENAKALKGDRVRDPEAEKLVLTPALRIDESEVPAPQADVFAVDTETWSDVPREAEATENKGVFSHKERRPSVVVDTVSGAGQATEHAAANAPQAVEPDAGTTPWCDDSEPGEGEETGEATNEADVGEVFGAKPESDTQMAAETESQRAEMAAANDLEQRIAELETAMDLHPAGEKTVLSDLTDPRHDDVGRGEEETAQAAPVTSETSEAASDTEATTVEPTAGEDATGPDTPEAADAAEATATEPAADAGEQKAAEVSDAPPRSWIEGLVAAAAAAEAARLAERAKTRADDDESRGAEAATSADAAAETETIVDAEAEVDEAVTHESPPEHEEDAADTGTFELTEAHAAPPEPEAVHPDAAVKDGNEPGSDEAETETEVLAVQAAEDLPEASDLPETGDVSQDMDASAHEVPEARASDATEATDAPEAADTEDAAQEPDAEDAATEDAATEEAATQEAEVDESRADVEAGPERSWVDRLIAAAATLRTAPPPAGADETADDDGLDSESAEETAVAAEGETPAGEVDTDAEETMAAEPADEGDVGTEAANERVAPLALEPLNLVDPIATGTDAEASVPEWEPVEPPEQAEPETDEPIVDIDTVLTGPWTAAAVEDTAADAPNKAADPIADEDTTAATAAEIADEEAAAEAAEEIADDKAPEDTEEATAEVTAAAADEVPVGALEWEPVDASEQPDSDAESAPETASSGPAALGDSAREAAETGVEAEASEDADSTDVEGAADDEEEVVFDSHVATQEFDFHDEGDPEDGDGEGASAPDQGEIHEADEADKIDEDSAAVAAAAEAEADWEDAGMAAAGVAMAATGLDTHDRADETAAPDADIEALNEASLENEAVIDEAMLRELVAQLVRDELQGTVGERITHNVRRLIRREIARALTLQDFEK